MIMSLTMMVLGTGALCALLYRFAVHALALLVAVAAGTWIYELTANTFGSIAGGALAGAIALIAGPLLFAASRTPFMRLLLACAYGLPAGYAGYQIGISLLRLGAVDGYWLHGAAALAAIVTGLTAVIRLANPDTPDRQDSLA